MSKIKNTQQNAIPENNFDANERLYQLIRKRVKWTTFSRLAVDPGEVANEVFLRWVSRDMPAIGTEEFPKRLRRMVRHVIRDYLRFSKPALDVDEIDEDEHPLYEMNFFSEEAEFELVFEKFCESLSEPKRTVFAKSRTLSKNNIAELTGLSERYVIKLVKLMPGEFKTFFENFSKTFSH